jgi:hypothetical protein
LWLWSKRQCHVKGNLWENSWRSIVVHNHMFATCRSITMLPQGNPWRCLCMSWLLVCTCRFYGCRNRWRWEITNHSRLTFPEHRQSHHLCR